MTIDQDTFRSLLGRFASGVTVVTVRSAAGTDEGMTVSAFCSLSLEPLMVLVCIEKTASMHPSILAAEKLAVNILSEDQEALARRFSAIEPDRFEGVGFTRGENGVAILDESLAFLECTIAERHDAGDHTLVICRVDTGDWRDGEPLLYYRGGYAQLER